MGNVLVVFIIFVLFPGIILAFILLSRYLKYRETLTMIQHGITPPPPMVMMPSPPLPQRPVVVNQGGGGRATLIWGLVLTGIGIALTLALWPIGFIANSASGNTINFPLGLGPWMLAGFVPLFVGLALTLGYVITRPERANGPNPPSAQTDHAAHAAQRAPATAPVFPTEEGRAVRVYSHASHGNGAPIVPTEPVVPQEGSESAPPSA